MKNDDFQNDPYLARQRQDLHLKAEKARQEKSVEEHLSSQDQHQLSEQDRRDLSKALGYAHWSALGLFIPFIGWLLGGMSLSFIKTIPINHKTVAKIKQIKRAAWTGIVVSSIAAAAWGALLKYNTHQADLEQSNIQQQQERAIGEENRRQIRAQNGLNNCLKQADDSYWHYVKINATSSRPGENGSTTYYMPQQNWDYAAEQKKTAQDECYRKYNSGLFDNYLNIY